MTLETDLKENPYGVLNGYEGQDGVKTLFDERVERLAQDAGLGWMGRQKFNLGLDGGGFGLIEGGEDKLAKISPYIEVALGETLAEVQDDPSRAAEYDAIKASIPAGMPNEENMGNFFDKITDSMSFETKLTTGLRIAGVPQDQFPGIFKVLEEDQQAKARLEALLFSDNGQQQDLKSLERMVAQVRDNADVIKQFASTPQLLQNDAIGHVMTTVVEQQKEQVPGAEPRNLKTVVTETIAADVSLKDAAGLLQATSQLTPQQTAAFNAAYDALPPQRRTDIEGIFSEIKTAAFKGGTSGNPMDTLAANGDIQTIFTPETLNSLSGFLQLQGAKDHLIGSIQANAGNGSSLKDTVTNATQSYVDQNFASVSNAATALGVAPDKVLNYNRTITQVHQQDPAIAAGITKLSDAMVSKNALLATQQLDNPAAPAAPLDIPALRAQVETLMAPETMQSLAQIATIPGASQYIHGRILQADSAIGAAEIGGYMSDYIHAMPLNQQLPVVAGFVGAPQEMLAAYNQNREGVDPDVLKNIDKITAAVLAPALSSSLNGEQGGTSGLQSFATLISPETQQQFEVLAKAGLSDKMVAGIQKLEQSGQAVTYDSLMQVGTKVVADELTGKPLGQQIGLLADLDIVSAQTQVDLDLVERMNPAHAAKLAELIPVMATAANISASGPSMADEGLGFIAKTPALLDTAAFTMMSERIKADPSKGLAETAIDVVTALPLVGKIEAAAMIANVDESVARPFVQKIQSRIQDNPQLASNLNRAIDAIIDGGAGSMGGKSIRSLTEGNAWADFMGSDKVDQVLDVLGSNGASNVLDTFEKRMQDYRMRLARGEDATPPTLTAATKDYATGYAVIAGGPKVAGMAGMISNFVPDLEKMDPASFGMMEGLLKNMKSPATKNGRVEMFGFSMGMGNQMGYLLSAGSTVMGHFGVDTGGLSPRDALLGSIYAQQMEGWKGYGGGIDYAQVGQVVNAGAYNADGSLRLKTNDEDGQQYAYNPATGNFDLDLEKLDIGSRNTIAAKEAEKAATPDDPMAALTKGIKDMTGVDPSALISNMNG